MKLDKLDAVLALSSTSRQDAALFAEMLSMPNDGRYPTLELTPQQRRQKTLEALFSGGVMSFSVATCHDFWRPQRRAYGATMPSGTPTLQKPLRDMIRVCVRSCSRDGAFVARPP